MSPRARIRGTQHLWKALKVLAGEDVNSRIVWGATAAVSAVALCAHLAGSTRPAQAQGEPSGEWAQRTPWGDPNLQGEWTSEGEFGVPFERPAEFGTREFLTDEEYAKRLADVRQRDERDLQSGRRARGQGRWAERTDSALA